MIPKIIHYCWFGGLLFERISTLYWELAKIFARLWNQTLGWDQLWCALYPILGRSLWRGQICLCQWLCPSQTTLWVWRYILWHRCRGYQPLDDIIADGPFMAFEKDSNARKGELLNVAVGLGFAVEPHNPILRETIDFYESHHYIYPDGHMEQITIVKIVTDILKNEASTVRISLSKWMV